MSQLFFEMLSRVYTFSIGNWPYIDAKQLCPYRLASLGYYVSKPLFLQCSVCHHQVEIPSEIDSDYKQTIDDISNHKPNCIYQEYESSQQQSQQQSTIKKQQLYLLMDQINIQLKQKINLLGENKVFPLLNRKEITQKIDEEKFIFKTINQAYRLQWPKQISIAFFLQLFGWGIKKDQLQQNKLSLECFLCGRKLHLNSLTTIQKNQQTQETNQENSFSPVSEHRYFCLWVNPKCSGFSGYTIFLTHLIDKINESKSLFHKTLPQDTKKIRVQIDKYLESFKQKTSQQFEKIMNIFNECQEMKNSIRQKENEQYIGQGHLFNEGQVRMKQFVEDTGDIKKQIKKIKL